MKEICRRSNYYENDNGDSSIVAEIVVENDEKKVYLYGSWFDFTDSYEYGASTKSFYDANERMVNARNVEEEKKAIEEINSISSNRIKDNPIFSSFYVELEQMIKYEMKKHDLEYFYEEDEEEGS